MDELTKLREKWEKGHTFICSTKNDGMQIIITKFNFRGYSLFRYFTISGEDGETWNVSVDLQDVGEEKIFRHLLALAY